MTSFNGINARDSILDLRTYLSDVLKNELGVFASTNTPAIWVEPPFMSERSTVTGVAVIISRYESNLSQSNFAVSPQSLQNFDWEVVIRAYDKSSAGLIDFDRAIANMRKAFSQFREIMLTTSENIFPQVRYLLSTSRIVNRFPLI